MRFTTVISLLFASWALLSGSPAVHAAPVPSPDGSIGIKQRCLWSECRVAESASGSSTDTNTTIPINNVQNLVKVLIDALQKYQTEETPSNTTTTVDLATPEEAGDQSVPVPVIDALLGNDSDPTL